MYDILLLRAGFARSSYYRRLDSWHFVRTYERTYFLYMVSCFSIGVGACTYFRI